MKHDIPASETKGGRIYVPIADVESLRALGDGISGKRREKIIGLLQKEDNPCRSVTPPASLEQIIDNSRESVVPSSEHLPGTEHLRADLDLLQFLHVEDTPWHTSTPPASPEQFSTSEVSEDLASLLDVPTPSNDFDASTSDDCFDHILCMFD
eukprot:m.151693 g.151693  ORF g.151693 m.151693 type:complete len:153 (-) comp17871_c0_seq9:59-517(-)